jgi:protein-tyrosine phosphatase
MSRLLVVCTANICRSPMAQSMLVHRLGPAWQVASAGTLARPGQPMTPMAAEVVAARGIPLVEHRSRRLEPALVEAADLILTATREHRAAVVGMVPRALRRTVTLRELARLARLGGPAASVAELVALRGAVVPARPEDDDLEDPYGGPREGYEQCAALVAADLDAILPALLR